jgi:hypothetical protein
MQPRFIATAFGALAVMTPVVMSSAQQPAPLRQPEAVPFEVAAALVSAGGFSGEPQILVGSMPEWIANRVYIPSNARVLGSAFLGTTVVAVITLPSASDDIIAEFTRELLKRGWTTPPPPPSYQTGGFRPAPPVAEKTPTRVTLCGDQQLLSVSAARRRGVATDVTMRVSTSTNYSPCRPPQMPTMLVRSPYPTLYNPASATDARMMGDCSSDISGGMSTGTTLRTDMTPDALLDHYGRQLQDSGWKSLTDASVIIGRSWTRPDSSGTPVELLLTVGSSMRAASCHDVNLQVRKVQRR